MSTVNIKHSELNLLFVKKIFTMHLLFPSYKRTTRQIFIQ